LIVIPGLTGDPEENVNGYFVYMMASQRNGTLYIGVSSDLVKRVWQHKTGAIEGFTKEYGVHLLVYYEAHDEIEQAIKREKTLKKWNRMEIGIA